MNKFLPLLLCLLLSIFTVARATKLTDMAVPNMKTAHNEPRGQEGESKTLLNDANTGEDVPSDGDDSTEPASSNDGEEANDDGDRENCRGYARDDAHGPHRYARFGPARQERRRRCAVITQVEMSFKDGEMRAISVLGTFAMYCREPRGPNGSEIEWVDAATDLAAVTIGGSEIRITYDPAGH